MPAVFPKDGMLNRNALLPARDDERASLIDKRRKLIECRASLGGFAKRREIGSDARRLRLTSKIKAPRRHLRMHRLHCLTLLPAVSPIF